MKHQVNWLFFTITNQPHEARRWRIVNAASADADRIIAKASSDEAALAQAQSDIASMEAQAVSVVQPLADKLSASAPPQ